MRRAARGRARPPSRPVLGRPPAGESGELGTSERERGGRSGERAPPRAPALRLRPAGGPALGGAEPTPPVRGPQGTELGDRSAGSSQVGRKKAGISSGSLLCVDGLRKKVEGKLRLFLSVAAVWIRIPEVVRSGCFRAGNFY